MTGADWTQVAIAVSTFLAVVVALFKEEIIRWWRRPMLVARLRLEAPDCHKTTVTIIKRAEASSGNALTVDAYYFRLWVENRGRQTAERVQVFAERLLKKAADGSYREVKSFLPMNLRWAHSPDPSRPEIFADSISPEMGRHCDLGHIFDPGYAIYHQVRHPEALHGAAVLALDLEVAPNTLSHLLPPGEYQLHLKIAASNAPPRRKRLAISWTGKWYQDETKMFSEGIGIVELD